jgi:transposase
MPRTAQFAEQVVEVAQQIVQKAMTARELRTGLSIIIPKECGVSNEVAAKALNIGVATVVRMQRRIRDQVDGKEEEKSSWGGRRRQTMSIEEESGFLRPWVEKAETGGVLVVPPIRAALEDRLGHPVAPSTVYRMLARHGWRKVEPDTCHPKRDPQAQDDFKKNSQKSWKKLPI